MSLDEGHYREEESLTIKKIVARIILVIIALMVVGVVIVGFLNMDPSNRKMVMIASAFLGVVFLFCWALENYK